MLPGSNHLKTTFDTAVEVSLTEFEQAVRTGLGQVSNPGVRFLSLWPSSVELGLALET